MLFNLVDNACKYARGGEPATIEVTVMRRGGRFVLTLPLAAVAT